MELPALDAADELAAIRAAQFPSASAGWRSDVLADISDALDMRSEEEKIQAGRAALRAALMGGR